MSSLKVDKGFRLIIIGAGPTAFGMLHRIYSLITEGTISEEDIQVVYFISLFPFFILCQCVLSVLHDISEDRVI